MNTKRRSDVHNVWHLRPFRFVQAKGQNLDRNDKYKFINIPVKNTSVCLLLIFIIGLLKKKLLQFKGTMCFFFKYLNKYIIYDYHDCLTFFFGRRFKRALKVWSLRKREGESADPYSLDNCRLPYKVSTVYWWDGVP